METVKLIFYDSYITLYGVKFYMKSHYAIGVYDGEFNFSELFFNYIKIFFSLFYIALNVNKINFNFLSDDRVELKLLASPVIHFMGYIYEFSTREIVLTGYKNNFHNGFVFSDNGPLSIYSSFVLCFKF